MFMCCVFRQESKFHHHEGGYLESFFFFTIFFKGKLLITQTRTAVLPTQGEQTDAHLNTTSEIIMFLHL
jgi:hypothetical protein